MKKSFLAVLLAAMVIVSVLSSCATSTQKSPAETIPESIAEPVRAEQEQVQEEEQPVLPSDPSEEEPSEEEPAVTEVPSVTELHEYEIMGVGIDVYVSPGHAELLYPADMADQKTVSEFLAYAIESYGYMLEGLSYEVADGEIDFRYPAQWGYAELGLMERILTDSAPLFFGQTAAPVEEEPEYIIEEIAEEQTVLTPEQKAEAGIEIVGTSTGETGTYSLEDIIAMYQPEGENPETSTAPAYLPAEDDLSGFEFLEPQTIDLSEFTWITDVKDGSAAEKIQQSVSEISAAEERIQQSVSETSAAAEADKQAETAAPVSAEKQAEYVATEDPKGVSASLVVWILVGIGLAALGIVTLMSKKKRK